MEHIRLGKQAGAMVVVSKEQLQVEVSAGIELAMVGFLELLPHW